uniref:SFR19-like C-terminal domain-containing protein n=1 Tax=Leersia perrieri TaxID=77586 RepID=A0A0D9VR81_9ORYZ
MAQPEKPPRIPTSRRRSPSPLDPSSVARVAEGESSTKPLASLPWGFRSGLGRNPEAASRPKVVFELAGGDFAKGFNSELGMYGQGGNFNPQYRHAAPPPPPQQAGQPLPPPPPRMAQYPQPPAMAQPPPGAYQPGRPPVQNQPYPFAPMHQMQMLPQQRGYAQMPMPGPPSQPPPPQAMYQGHPQYPMPGPLPPPPPRPPSFAPENVLPPSSPPPPPPPPPPSSPPPAPPLPSAVPTTKQSWESEPERKGATDGCHDVKTEKAANQLIVSDDSDMDMDADEDSPSREHLSPINSSLATAECTGNVNAPKSVSDVSSLGNGSDGKAKTTNVTEEGRSPFQLIQGYASGDSEDEDDAGAGAASNLVTENNEPGHSINANPCIGHQLLTEAAPCTGRGLEAQEHQLMDKSNPVKHVSDELGHLNKEDLGGNDSDRVQQSRRHGRSQWKRSRGQSPQGRKSCSPLSQSVSPGRQSSSLLAKRANLLQSKLPDGVGHTFRAEHGVKLGISKDGFYNDKHDAPAKVSIPFESHPAGGGNISGDIISEQEGLMRTKKLQSSSDDLNGDEQANDVSVGSLGPHGHGAVLTVVPSQSMASSENASDPHKMQSSDHASIPQSDIDKSSLAAHQSLVSQSPVIPFATVHATEKSMACDVLQSHPQNLCPGQMPSGLRPAHIPSVNMTPLPGKQLLSSSEFPQMHFQPNVMVPASEFLQSQMQTYPPPDLSHPRPLDFHPHTLQPAVPSHQQPAAIVHSSFQRYPSNLPGSSDYGLSDTDLPKSSIKPHYNPFASTFEETDPSLNIGCDAIPNTVGSASTKAAEHMNGLSPFGLSVPGTGTRAREKSVEVVSSRHHRELTSSAPYDPLLDSIEPSSSSINKMDLGRETNLSASNRNASKIVNIEVESKNMHGLGLVAESVVEEFGEVAADTETGVVENLSPEPLGAKDWSSEMPGDIDNDESVDKNKTKDSRSMKLFKVAIADFVKEVLKPSWRQGNISREAFKTIVRKTVDKVSNSVPNNHIPKTPAKIKQYVQSSQKKVTKLVMVCL